MSNEGQQSWSMGHDSYGFSKATSWHLEKMNAFVVHRVELNDFIFLQASSYGYKSNEIMGPLLPSFFVWKFSELEGLGYSFLGKLGEMGIVPWTFQRFLKTNLG